MPSWEDWWNSGSWGWGESSGGSGSRGTSSTSDGPHWFWGNVGQPIRDQPGNAEADDWRGTEWDPFSSGFDAVRPDTSSHGGWRDSDWNPFTVGASKESLPDEAASDWNGFQYTAANRESMQQVKRWSISRLFEAWTVGRVQTAERNAWGQLRRTVNAAGLSDEDRRRAEIRIGRAFASYDSARENEVYFGWGRQQGEPMRDFRARMNRERRRFGNVVRVYRDELMRQYPRVPVTTDERARNYIARHGQPVTAEVTHPGGVQKDHQGMFGGFGRGLRGRGGAAKAARREGGEVIEDS